MAVTYGFYNSQNEDRKYDAEQVSSLFDGIITDGIYANFLDSFIVKKSTDMSVTVGTGRAWFNHTWILNDSLRVFSFSQSSSDRYYVILIKIDTLSRVNTIEYRTYTSRPSIPLNIDTTGVYYHPLALVYVPARSTYISYVRDLRGYQETPWVMGIITHVSAASVIEQWNQEYNDWFVAHQNDFLNWSTAQQESYEEWIARSKAEFLAWVTGMESSFQEWSEAEQTMMEDWIEDRQTMMDNWINEEQTLINEWADGVEQQFYDWFSNLQNELNEHQAAHLQEEINDLRRVVCKENNNLLSKIIYDIDGGIKSIVSNRPGYEKVLTFNQNGDVFTIRREVITNSVRCLDVIEYDKANGTITEKYTTSDGFEETKTSSVTLDEYGIITGIETTGEDYFRSLTFEDIGATAKVIETRSDAEDSYTDNIYYDGDTEITESYKGQTSVVTKGRNDDILRIETTGTDYSRDISFDFMDQYKNTYQIRDGKMEDGEYHVRTVLFNKSANTILEKYM